MTNEPETTLYAIACVVLMLLSVAMCMFALWVMMTLPPLS